MGSSPAGLFVEMRFATVQEACGSPPDTSVVCRRVFRWTHNEPLAKLARFFGDHLPTIVLIVVVSIVIHWLLQRAIKRLEARLTEASGPSSPTAGATAPGSTASGSTPLGSTPMGSMAPARRRAQRAATISTVLRSFTTFAVWVIALLMALGELGLQLGPLIAGAGIAGAALGFGATSLVRDFLSGMFMLVEDQYGVGDTIDAGGHSGRVEEVTLRVTRLRDDDGVVWYIPNGQITSVGNRSQRWSRAVVDVAIASTTNVHVAMGLLDDIMTSVSSDPEIGEQLLDAPEVLGIESTSADQYTIRVVARTTPLQQAAVARRLRRIVKEAFDAAGIPSTAKVAKASSTTSATDTSEG